MKSTLKTDNSLIMMSSVMYTQKKIFLKNDNYKAGCLGGSIG